MAGVLETARGYSAAGLSVIPVRADGTKAPAEAGWRAYSVRLASPEELAHWFDNGNADRFGIGITGGRASGNLAVLDFETDAAYVAWLKALQPTSRDLTRRCPLARTPGGGAHLYVRLTDPVPGTVLAWRMVDGKRKTLIEVRADGEQVVAPGSPPACHPSGKLYEWVRRGWLDGGAVVPLPLEEWFEWLETATGLNEVEADPEPPPAPLPKPRSETGTKPGDDFNTRGTWEEAGLFEAGWQWFSRLEAERGFLTRPGKRVKDGKSATVGLVTAKDGGHPLFYPFSTDCAPFAPRQGYSRWRVYAILAHKGDYEAAARALGRMGYGDQSRGGATAFITKAVETAEPKRPPATSVEGGPPRSETVETPTGPQFQFTDSAEFLAGDYRPRWLVPRILVRGQPGVIAGPSKGMKTSLLVDLAVSLATATPFLGTFPVRERVRVAVVSGESGEHTLKETCLRVLSARDLDRGELTGWLKWEFNLPTFSDLASMAEFGAALARIEADVVVIDPTYLALGDIDARNLFEMGKALRTIAAVLVKLRPGLTVVLVHHANRLLPVGEVMELQHLAYSGLEQFARQFILLNRREPYRNDGEHELWVRVGGSTGHGGLWSLHVSEGLVEEDFSGRRWDVEVSSYSDTVGDEKEAKKKRGEDARAKKEKDAEDAVIAQIDRAHEELKRSYFTPSWIHDQIVKSGKDISEGRVENACKKLTERGVLQQWTNVKVPIGDNCAPRPAKYAYGRPSKDLTDG